MNKSGRYRRAICAALFILATHIARVVASATPETQPVGFLAQFSPRQVVTTAMTGPGRVDRIRVHTLIFSPKVSKRVYSMLQAQLSEKHGWTRHEVIPQRNVNYSRQGYEVAYYSGKDYGVTARRPATASRGGANLGQCVVEYYYLKPLAEQAVGGKVLIR